MAIYMPRVLHMFKKDLRGPKLFPLAKPEDLNRQKIKVKAQLSTAKLSVKGVPQMHTGPLRKDWEIYWF